MIKTRNSKITANSQLSTTKPKQTHKTQIEQEQNHRNMGGLSAGRGQNGEKGTGNKKHNWQVQNRQGEVKNSVGNGEAKVFIGTTMNMNQGDERNAGGCGSGAGWRGIKGRKKMGQL